MKKRNRTHLWRSLCAATLTSAMVLTAVPSLPVPATQTASAAAATDATDAQEDFEPSDLTWEVESLSLADNDPETYTFYEGFNDNDYMGPSTKLLIRFANGYQAITVQDHPLRTSKTNSSDIEPEEDYGSRGACGGEDLVGLTHAADMSELVILDSKGNIMDKGLFTGIDLFGASTPLTISYDQENNTVSAELAGVTSPLYHPVYKPLSEMPSLTPGQETNLQGTNGTRFFRVSGDLDQEYIAYSRYLDTDGLILTDDDSMATLLDKQGTDLKSNDDNINFDFGLSYTPTKETPEYILQVQLLDPLCFMDLAVGIQEFIPPTNIQIEAGTYYPELDTFFANVTFTFSDNSTVTRTLSNRGDLDQILLSDKQYFIYFSCSTYEESNTIVLDAYLEGDTAPVFENTLNIDDFQQCSADSLPYYTLGNTITTPALGYGFYQIKPTDLEALHYLTHYNASTALIYFQKTDSGSILRSSQSATDSESTLRSYRLFEDSIFSLVNLKAQNQPLYLLVNNGFYNHSINSILFDDNAANADEIIDSFVDQPEDPKPTETPEVTETPAASDTPSETQDPEVSQAPSETPDADSSSSPNPAETPGANASASPLPTGTPGADSSAAPLPTGAPGANPSASPVPTGTPGVTSTTAPEADITGESVISGKVIYTAISQTEAQVTGVSTKKLAKATLAKTITIKGHTLTVTTVAPRAFANCKKLKTVTVKDPAITVKKNAFKKCKKVTFVVGKKHVKAFSKKLKNAKIGCKYKVK